MTERLVAYIEWKGEEQSFGIMRVYSPTDLIRYVWACSTERYRDNDRLHLQGFLGEPTKAGFRAIRDYCLRNSFGSVIWETVTSRTVMHAELFVNSLKCVRHRTHDVEAFLASVKIR